MTGILIPAAFKCFKSRSPLGQNERIRVWLKEGKIIWISPTLSWVPRSLFFPRTLWGFCLREALLLEGNGAEAVQSPLGIWVQNLSQIICVAFLVVPKLLKLQLGISPLNHWCKPKMFWLWRWEAVLCFLSRRYQLKQVLIKGEWSQNHEITESQNQRITESQNQRIMGWVRLERTTGGHLVHDGVILPHIWMHLYQIIMILFLISVLALTKLTDNNCSTQIPCAHPERCKITDFRTNMCLLRWQRKSTCFWFWLRDHRDLGCWEVIMGKSGKVLQGAAHPMDAVPGHCTDFTQGIGRNCLSPAAKALCRSWLLSHRSCFPLESPWGLLFSAKVFLSVHSDCSHGGGSFLTLQQGRAIFGKHFPGYRDSDFIFIQPLKSAGAAGISPGRRSQETQKAGAGTLRWTQWSFPTLMIFDSMIFALNPPSPFPFVWI